MRKLPIAVALALVLAAVGFLTVMAIIYTPVIGWPVLLCVFAADIIVLIASGVWSRFAKR